MKQQTYLHIAEPCHEKWDKMTSVEKGKFCGACSKQVIDFTLMSDQQILNYFSKASEGSTCGRFANDQLQRPLVRMHHDKKKSWWAAAVMPLLLFFNKTYSQGKPEVKQDTTVNCTKDQMIMGKVSRPILQGEVVPVINPDTYSETIQVKGKVLDENGKPVLGADIMLDEKNIATFSDEEGNFEFYIPREKHFRGTLTVSYVGYKIKEVPVRLDRRNTRRQNDIVIPPVVLEILETSECTIFVGFTSIVERPHNNIVDTIKRSIVNSIQEKEITVYPNPVTAGGTIRLKVNTEGDYSAALFNDEGKLLLTKEYHTSNKFSVADMQIPDMLSPGIYYLQFTNKKTRKQFSEKIIVQ